MLSQVQLSVFNWKIRLTLTLGSGWAECFLSSSQACDPFPWITGCFPESRCHELSLNSWEHGVTQPCPWCQAEQHHNSHWNLSSLYSNALLTFVPVTLRRWTCPHSKDKVLGSSYGTTVMYFFLGLNPINLWLSINSLSLSFLIRMRIILPAPLGVKTKSVHQVPHLPVLWYTYSIHSFPRGRQPFAS